MSKRALVLGGGGPVGIAWETGVAAGLAEGGVDLREADFTLGTSAGSVVGALLAFGRSPQEVMQVQLAMGGEGSSEAPALQPRRDATELMEKFMEWQRSDRPAEEVRKEIGAFALQAETMGEEEWVNAFSLMRMLGVQGWPERRYACTAIDATDGSFRVWDNDSGVDIIRAIASSCTVPGYFPPVTIEGRRYIDGGFRSATNADLAAGYDQVLVIALTGGAVAEGAGNVPGAGDVLEAVQRQFEEELETLRKGGSAVEVIVPDQESADAFGLDLMNSAHIPAAAEQGVRQGKTVADRLREWWA
jgi:NTE family protein